jgi:hypothetical protein
LAAFDASVEEAGEGASAELLYDKALAALRVGDRMAATAAAKAAAARGGPEIQALADFVRGNAAFALSEAAEEEANRPGGDPTAHERAVASTEDALAAWKRAAATRSDWPEARRNVERALLRLARLRERRSAADQPRPPPPQPPPPTPEAPPEPETPREVELETAELSPQEVLRLFELLVRKEQEKLEMRRAGRRARAGDVERDW